MSNPLPVIGCAGAGNLGAPMPITSLVEELNRKMVLDGMGDGDPAELVRMYRSKQGR